MIYSYSTNSLLLFAYQNYKKVCTPPATTTSPTALHLKTDVIRIIAAQHLSWLAIVFQIQIPDKTYYSLILCS